MEIGDGEYTEEEKSKDVLRKRTSLKNKRQESSFNSVEKAKDSAVKLKAAIDNRNVTNGYRMTEIGIFAKASGDTASDGVLYSIAVAVEADYMPPESTPITYIQEFYTKVGNAENVEITVSTGVYALAEDLAEVEEPTYTERGAGRIDTGRKLKAGTWKACKSSQRDHYTHGFKSHRECGGARKGVQFGGSNRQHRHGAGSDREKRNNRGNTCEPDCRVKYEFKR